MWWRNSQWGPVAPIETTGIRFMFASVQVEILQFCQYFSDIHGSFRPCQVNKPVFELLPLPNGQSIISLNVFIFLDSNNKISSSKILLSEILDVLGSLIIDSAIAQLRTGTEWGRCSDQTAAFISFTVMTVIKQIYKPVKKYGSNNFLTCTYYTSVTWAFVTSMWWLPLGLCCLWTSAYAWGVSVIGMRELGKLKVSRCWRRESGGLWVDVSG